MICKDPIRFDQWITYHFDHPVTEPAWYWNWNFSDLSGDVSDGDLVAYLTRTFEECDTVLSVFSDAQVNQGLRYLICAGLSDYPFVLLETAVPLVDRLRCIEAMATLFEQYFARRCSPHLVHEEGAGQLNEICYMWWELLPLHGLIKHRPDHPNAAALDRAIIEVQRRTLKLDSIACQESALFGLRWSAIYYPELWEDIEEFIEHHQDLWERFKPGVRTACFGWTD